MISGNNYTTDANTSLAAMYHQCLLCVNTTVMVFQDINDYVQFANLTTAGWTLIQLAVDPVNKTGLALQPFFRSGIEDQINLHYQNLNLNLSLASYVPAAVEEGG